MDFDARKSNFAIHVPNDQIDFQPKFLVAMDSSNSGEQMQNNEIVFLDGSLDDDSDDNKATNDDHDRNCFQDTDDFFTTGEEVDLKYDGIVDMVWTDTDDSDEPFQDSDGALYYICEKCTFVCIDRATLIQHTNENHLKSRPPRRRNNNSALRFSDIADSDDNGFDTSDEKAKINHSIISSSSSTSSLTPPPMVVPQSSSPLDDLKPYKCHICHKRLSTKANLRGHLTIHR